MTGTTASTINPLIVDYISPPPSGDKIRDAFEKTQINIDTIAENFNILITGGTLPFISGNSIEFNSISGDVSSNITTGQLFYDEILPTSTASTASITSSTINTQNLIYTDIEGTSSSTITFKNLEGLPLISTADTPSKIVVSNVFYDNISGDTGSTILTNSLTSNTLSSNTINVDDILFITISGDTGSTILTNSLTSNTLSSNTINVDDILFATISGDTGSTINVNDISSNTLNVSSITYSIMSGSTIFADFFSGSNVSFSAETLNFVNLSGSSASTMIISSITFNDIIGNSASTLNVGNISSSTINTDNLTSNTISYGSISGGSAVIDGGLNVSGSVITTNDVIVGDDLIAFGISGVTGELDTLTINNSAITDILTVSSTITASQINTTDITISGGTLQTLSPITQHKESFTINQSGATRESVIMSRPFTVSGIVVAGVDNSGVYTNIAFDTLSPVFVSVYLNGVLQESFEIPFGNIVAVPATYNFATPFTANAENVISVGTTGNPWDGSNKNVIVTLKGNLIL